MNNKLRHQIGSKETLIAFISYIIKSHRIHNCEFIYSRQVFETLKYKSIIGEQCGLLIPKTFLRNIAHTCTVHDTDQILGINLTIETIEYDCLY